MVVVCDGVELRADVLNLAADDHILLFNFHQLMLSLVIEQLVEPWSAAVVQLYARRASVPERRPTAIVKLACSAALESLSGKIGELEIGCHWFRLLLLTKLPALRCR